MTSKARQHLAKAKSYIAKGEAYYEKAADEIIAAQQVDPALGYPEIARQFGKGKDWPRRLVQWHTSGARASGGPIDWERGNRDVSGTRKVLREAPAEQIAEMLKEPSVRRKVEEAQEIALRDRVDKKERAFHGDESQDRVQKHEREVELLNDVHATRSRVLRTAKRLHDEHERGLRAKAVEEIGELFEDIRDAAEMALALLDNGERFDEELAELLKEGS